MAKFPRNIADSVTEKITAAQRPTRSLKSLRVREYSRAVVASMASRLTCPGGGQAADVVGESAEHGYRTGEPEKKEL